MTFFRGEAERFSLFFLLKIRVGARGEHTPPAAGAYTQRPLLR